MGLLRGRRVDAEFGLLKIYGTEIAAAVVAVGRGKIVPGADG